MASLCDWFDNRKYQSCARAECDVPSIIDVFIHLHIEVHLFYMVYSKDNTHTILQNIITDE